jgi:hypothetical protein
MDHGDGLPWQPDDVFEWFCKWFCRGEWWEDAGVEAPRIVQVFYILAEKNKRVRKESE